MAEGPEQTLNIVKALTEAIGTASSTRDGFPKSNGSLLRVCLAVLNDDFLVNVRGDDAPPVDVGEVEGGLLPRADADAWASGSVVEVDDVSASAEVLLHKREVLVPINGPWVKGPPALAGLGAASVRALKGGGGVVVTLRDSPAASCRKGVANALNLDLPSSLRGQLHLRA